jgi:hypothetical protein
MVCFLGLGWAFRYLGLFLEFDGTYRLITVDRMWITIMVRTDLLKIFL